MPFMQEYHTETTLTNTTTNTQGQLVMEQFLVEIQCLTLLLTLQLQLAEQRLLVDTDTHGRKLEGTS